MIEAAAGEAGRRISDEHFGVSIGYSTVALSDRARATLTARSRGGDPDRLVPVGWDATRALVERYIAEGFSKFVLRPLAGPDDWVGEVRALAGAVGDLQT